MAMPSNSPRPATQAPDRERRARSRDDPDQISLPSQIAHILQGLSSGHELVTVAVPGSDRRFTSAILGVDLHAGTVLMDELQPREGHGLLVKTRELRVNARFHGVELTFRSSVAAVDRAGGIAIYRVALPKKLSYNQRRQHYRLVIGLTPAVSVSIEYPGGLLQGRVHDISVGGIGARFAPADEEEMRTGDRLESCLIELPEVAIVQSPLQVCFIERRWSPCQLRLGGQFLSLSKGDEQQIARFITGLERKRLKVRPKS
jgi:c-di-GMP-binding flagellar brake protein YcgR